MRFALYDSVSGGNQVGLTVNISAVQITNGIFTVSLDYTAAEFAMREFFVAAGGGAAWTVISGKFGALRFEDVAAGETYIFSIHAPKYVFSQPVQVRSNVEDTANIVFTANFRAILLESF